MKSVENGLKPRTVASVTNMMRYESPQKQKIMIPQSIMFQKSRKYL